MRTPADIYALPVTRTSKALYDLPEEAVPLLPEYYLENSSDGQNERVEIRQHRYIDAGDGIRCWVLSSVWFDGHPVMVVQEAGRDGRDHFARFVTDEKRYVDMAGYLAGLFAESEIQRSDETVPLYEVNSDLDAFYGESYDQT